MTWTAFTGGLLALMAVAVAVVVVALWLNARLDDIEEREREE